MKELKVTKPERAKSLKHDASEASDLPVTECRFRYIVCSTQRTGSSLACRALRNTDKAGQPLEFFHPSLISAFLARLDKKGISPAAFLTFLESHRSTANGVFGIKMHLDQLNRAFKDDKKRTDFLNRFDRAILISRRNKLAQAVSYARAIQTQHWEAEKDDVANRARNAEARYDVTAVAKMLSSLVADDQRWRDVLSSCRVPCYTVTYEELVDDYSRTMGGISSFLGIDQLDERAFSTPPLLKLGDELNIDWERRFIADIQGHPTFERTH